MTDYTNRLEKAMLRHLGYEVSDPRHDEILGISTYTIRKRWMSDGGGEPLTVELEVAKMVAIHHSEHMNYPVEDVAVMVLRELDRFADANERQMYRDRIRMMNEDGA